MFVVNGTFVIFLVSFIVFVYLLNQILLKPVGKAIEDRQALVKGDIEAGRSARSKAEELLSKYEADLHHKRTEAQSIINDSATSTAKENSSRFEALKKDCKDKLNSAKTQISSEKTTAKEGLISHQADFVKAVVHKLLGEQLDFTLADQDVKKALEEAC